MNKFKLTIHHDPHAGNPFEEYEDATKLYMNTRKYRTPADQGEHPYYKECTICGEDVDYNCGCDLAEGYDFRTETSVWRPAEETDRLAEILDQTGEVIYETDMTEEEFYALPVSEEPHYEIKQRYPVIVAGEESRYGHYSRYNEPDPEHEYDIYVYLDQETIDREWNGDLELAKKYAISSFNDMELWSSGQTWGFVLEKLTTCECCGSEDAEEEDALWGMRGELGSDEFTEHLKSYIPEEHHHLIEDAVNNPVH